MTALRLTTAAVLVGLTLGLSAAITDGQPCDGGRGHLERVGVGVVCRDGDRR